MINDPQISVGWCQACFPLVHMLSMLYMVQASGTCIVFPPRALFSHMLPRVGEESMGRIVHSSVSFCQGATPTTSVDISLAIVGYLA